MMPTETSLGPLRRRISSAQRQTAALEATYEAMTLGQLVTLRARTHGSKVAISIFERDESATYSEMDRRSNQYAHALRSAGVMKGDRVGVMLPNRIDFPILWFALAKLGAVLVPLNMRYTPREIEYALSDTQAKFAVIDESVCSLFFGMEPWPAPLAKDRVFVVGQPAVPGMATLESLTDGAHEGPVNAVVDSEDLLNIQYTSGTTGFPKGCMLTHEYWSVTSFVSAQYEEQCQRFLAWVPFFYMYGQTELLKSYRLGGTLYMAQRLSSRKLLQWISAHGIESCTIPELVALQVESGDQAAASLRQIVADGGGWNLATRRQFRQRCAAYVYDPFAMTEIGWGTQMPRELEEMTQAVGSLGTPAPFRDLRLVTEEGRDAAVGEVGELWVRGRGIFKGYWNRPEANAECLEDGWFKTGDLMSRDEFGIYFLVGRSKEMIRRSGENISAREVEAVVGEIAEIAGVAAVPVHDSKRGEEVKICVELHEGLTPDQALIRRILDHAASRLAAFKVPRYVAFVATLPRTVTSNKVLKRDLMDVADPLAGSYDADEQRWR